VSALLSLFAKDTSAPLIFIVLTLPLPFILRPGHYHYSDVISGFLAMLESAAARFSRVSP
jgi:hypothetical protein